MAMFYACGDNPLPCPAAATVKVTFSILDEMASTRRTNVGPEDERMAGHWVLLLYRDGKLADYGVSTSGDITREMETGDYTACAVVNAPEDAFRPESAGTLTQWESTLSDLADNALPGLVMAGRRNLRIPEGTESGAQAIPVDRLVFKSGVRKISVRMEDPSLAARPFVLKAVYLTNCPRKTRLGQDLSVADLSGESLWANRMGIQPDPPGNGLLADTGIDAAVTATSPHTVPHFFYGYPNPVGADGDSRSRGAWSPRCTRLVIEAAVGGKTYYYPVTLPATARNRTYIAEEAVIRGLGSLDPEEEVPGAVEAVFSASVQEWAPEYAIHEQS